MVRMRDGPDDRRDFFVSFNQADRLWATWIAWVLEEDGYSVFFQDWDFGGNFIEHMNRAHNQAHRTLAVLSDYYFGSDLTLAEWSARFAQDPASRKDLLVPVKVGTLTGESILGPIIYADLTECSEEVAQERLLGRVRKAVDASYRSKPESRPGFPDRPPPRQVPAKPVFPQKPPEPITNSVEGRSRMPGNRSISVGRDTNSSVTVTGDNNQIDAKLQAAQARTSLPPAGMIDIGQELARIRAVLERIGGENAGKIERALDDATDEANRPSPNKDEVGRALDRALVYAKASTGFAEDVSKLAPQVKNVVAWLGANWRKLLDVVGLAV
jgi:hypothetical protein